MWWAQVITPDHIWPKLMAVSRKCRSPGTRKENMGPCSGYDQNFYHRFSRPVRAICLFCHNDLTTYQEGTLSAYKTELEGISCALPWRRPTSCRRSPGGPNPAVGTARPSYLQPGTSIDGTTT